MKLDDKRLHEIIKRNLREFPMDLPPGNEPDPDIQRQLARGETPFKKVEFPEPEGEGPETNFQELLASERYREVIQKVQQYTGRPVSIQGTSGVMPLHRAAMESLQNIIRTEMAHREELEQLAIEVVKNDMNIPDDAFQWDVKIVGLGEVDMEGMEMGNQEENDENAIENEIEIANDLQNLDLEKAKRRLINSIIQGSAMKGYYLYHNVADRLQQITGSDSLIRDYGIMMSINDTLYWQLPDEMMSTAMQSGAAGSEEVDRNTEPPTIKARGVNFPVLIHEIIKGVMEMFAVQGLPEDGSAQDVIASEDTLEKEIWDIRLGPSIWSKIRSSFPEEVLTDEAKRGLQNWILVEIFKLEPKKFLVLTKEVLSQSDRGRQLIAEIYDAVKRMLDGEEPANETNVFQEDLNELTEETPDDDIDDFLNNLKRLGIGRASEEPETEPSRPETQSVELSNKKLAEMGLNALNFELNKAIDNEDWELAQRIQTMIDRKQGA